MLSQCRLLLQFYICRTEDIIGFYISKNGTNIILDIVEGTQYAIKLLIQEKCPKLLQHDIIRFSEQTTKPEYLHNDWKRIIVADEGAEAISDKQYGTIACIVRLPSDGKKNDIYAMTAQHVIQKGLGPMQGEGYFYTDSILNKETKLKGHMALSEKYFGVMGGKDLRSKAVDISMLPVREALFDLVKEMYNVQPAKLNVYRGEYKDISNVHFKGASTFEGIGILKHNNYFAQYEDEKNEDRCYSGALVVFPDPNGKTDKFAMKGDSGSLVYKGTSQGNADTAIGIVSKIHYNYKDEDGTRVDANIVCRMEECIDAMKRAHNLNLDPNQLEVIFLEEI